MSGREGGGATLVASAAEGFIAEFSAGARATSGKAGGAAPSGGVGACSSVAGAIGTGVRQAKGRLIAATSAAAANRPACGRWRFFHHGMAAGRGCRAGEAVPSNRASAPAIAASRAFGAGGGGSGNSARRSSLPLIAANPSTRADERHCGGDPDCGEGVSALSCLIRTIARWSIRRRVHEDDAVSRVYRSSCAIAPAVFAARTRLTSSMR